MQTGDILVIGGYGAVGQTITLVLADQFPGRVIVAGRSYQKAQALAQKSGAKIRPYQLDLTTAHKTPEILDDVALVIMCLDVPDMQFVRLCLQRGVNYIDITAEDAILQQIEALADMAKAGGSTAVLSVGLSPGLSNLLVRQIQNQLDSVHHVDISILLGLGQAHGMAAVHWTLRNLNAHYTIRENGQPRRVSSFIEHKQTAFPVVPGRRRVYRFNLADQHVVTRTLNVPAASTWITFDPPLITRLIALMRRSGLSKLLRYRWIETSVVKLSTAVHAGSEKFVIQVTGQGEKAGDIVSETVAVSGEGQSRATALVTIQVATQLLTDSFPPGVYHSEQLFDPLPFIHRLAADDILFYDNERVEEEVS